MRVRIKAAIELKSFSMVRGRTRETKGYERECNEVTADNLKPKTP